jgi:hypothetical protein
VRESNNGRTADKHATTPDFGLVDGGNRAQSQNRTGDVQHIRTPSTSGSTTVPSTERTGV